MEKELNCLLPLHSKEISFLCELRVVGYGELAHQTHFLFLFSSSCSYSTKKDKLIQRQMNKEGLLSSPGATRASTARRMKCKESCLSWNEISPRQRGGAHNPQPIHKKATHSFKSFQSLNSFTFFVWLVVEEKHEIKRETKPSKPPIVISFHLNLMNTMNCLNFIQQQRNNIKLI